MVTVLATGYAFRFDFHLLAANGYAVLFANFRDPRATASLSLRRSSAIGAVMDFPITWRRWMLPSSVDWPMPPA